MCLQQSCLHPRFFKNVSRKFSKAALAGNNQGAPPKKNDIAGDKLLQGCQVLPRLRELTFLHAFSHVVVHEGTFRVPQHTTNRVLAGHICQAICGHGCFAPVSYSSAFALSSLCLTSGNNCWRHLLRAPIASQHDCAGVVAIGKRGENKALHFARLLHDCGPQTSS